MSGTIAEKIAAELERQAAIDNAKAELKHWQSIAMTQQRRKADAERAKAEETRKAAEARAEAEAKAKAEREEAAAMQPSHYNGQPNVLHFIPETQPKKRTDDASVASSEDIAANINPEEITSSVTAYTGAPMLNARGETVHGGDAHQPCVGAWQDGGEQDGEVHGEEVRRRRPSTRSAPRWLSSWA